MAAPFQGDLRAQYGLDAGAFRRPAEAGCCVQAVMVRKGEGRHAFLRCGLDELFREGRAVEEGKIRMGVKLNVHAVIYVRRIGRRAHPFAAAPIPGPA